MKIKSIFTSTGLLGLALLASTTNADVAGYTSNTNKSGKGRFLSGPPHTTVHAGPHTAVH